MFVYYDDGDNFFDRVMHDRKCSHHSGKKGHYCPEWDALYICEDCPEYKACKCFKEKDYGQTRIDVPV